MLLWKGQQYNKMPAHLDLQCMVTFQHIFQQFGPRTEHHKEWRHSEGPRHQNNTKWKYYMPEGVVPLSLHIVIEKQENEFFYSSLLGCKDLYCKITLKMDTENFSKTMVSTYSGRSCNIPDS